jgi:hypothetical protein
VRDRTQESAHDSDIQYVPRTLIIAALIFMSCPAIARAQDWTIPVHTLTHALASAPTPSIVITSGSTSSLDRLAASDRSTSPEIARTPRLGVFLPLYASFAGLQALDAHSTMRAIRAGGREANPLLRDLANRPAGLLALKAGVTASTIFLTEKMRVKNRVGAMVVVAALDSVYAMVVVHNYRAVR